MERASEIRRQLRDEIDGAKGDSTQSKPEISRMVSGIHKDGRVLNSNQAQARFKLEEVDDTVVLIVKIPK